MRKFGSLNLFPIIIFLMSAKCKRMEKILVIGQNFWNRVKSFFHLLLDYLSIEKCFSDYVNRCMDGHNKSRMWLWSQFKWVEPFKNCDILKENVYESDLFLLSIALLFHNQWKLNSWLSKLRCVNYSLRTNELRSTK